MKLSPIAAEDFTNQLLDGFDPDLNEWDRRILFEVTGIRLRQSDFNTDESAESEEEK